MKGSFVLSCHTHSMIKLATAPNTACTGQMRAFSLTLSEKQPPTPRRDHAGQVQIQRLVTLSTKARPCR